MTDHQSKYQPGPVFADVFFGGLRAMGSNSRDFAASINYKFQNLRSVAVGLGNGPRAVHIRNQMIEFIGPELFDALYEERMARETARKAAQ